MSQRIDTAAERAKIDNGFKPGWADYCAALDEIDRLTAALAEADARGQRLVESLQPFAVMAEAYDPEGDGMDDDYSWYPGARPTIGDLRRARAALTAMDTPAQGGGDE